MEAIREVRFRWLAILRLRLLRICMLGQPLISGGNLLHDSLAERIRHLIGRPARFLREILQ